MSEKAQERLRNVAADWVGKLRIKYKPMADDFYKKHQTPPTRLAELFVALDYHAIHNPEDHDDVPINIGYGNDLDWGIVPFTKKDTETGIEVPTYVATAVIDDKLVLITADDADRPNRYMEEHEVRVDSEMFKADEVLACIKDVQDKHGISDDDIYYVNYTRPGLEERANAHRKDFERDQLRWSIKMTGGRAKGWSDVIYDDGEYLKETLEKSTIKELTYTSDEQIVINKAFDSSVKEVPSEVEIDGETHDFEAMVDEVVALTILAKQAHEAEKKISKELTKLVEDYPTDGTKRVTCGDNRMKSINRFKKPEEIIEAFKEVNPDLDLDVSDIMVENTITRRSTDHSKVVDAAEKAGVVVKDIEKRTPSLGMHTTKVFKEGPKEQLEEINSMIIKGILSKAAMYEPGDKENIAATDAPSAGY